MAKTMTLEEQIAHHEAAIAKLRNDAAAAAVKTAEDKKGELQEALANYNEAAAATGGRMQKLRLMSDAERAAPASGKGGGKRLRLDSETEANISDKIAKAVKAHKDGASKANIIKYLTDSGYTYETNYNDGHFNKLVKGLLEGKTIKKEGDKSTTRYFAA